MAGRIPKYTDEVGKAIIEAVAKGVPESIAAQAAGINPATLRKWKAKKVLFGAGVKRARADAVRVRVERIYAAADGGAEIEVSEKTIKHKDGKLERIVIRKKTPPQWTADAWYLERQFCEEFGLNRLDLKELLKLLRESKKDRESKDAS